MTRKEVLRKYENCSDRDFVNNLFRKLDRLHYFNDEWVVRSGPYHKLNWRNNEKGIGKIIEMLDLVQDYRLLVVDAGAGTGKISLAIAEYTDSCGMSDMDVNIYAIDQSYAMLNKCPEHRKIKKYVADVERMKFISDNSVDRIICSMVLHSEYKDIDRILKEFWRILKEDGMLVIFESIPMVDNNSFLDFYNSFLTLKEDRVMFTKSGLIEKIRNVGFNFDNIVVEEIVLEQQSIKNWLQNSCTEEDLIDEIMDIHRNASDIIKKGINLVEKREIGSCEDDSCKYDNNMDDVDILCDWKFGIIRGMK